MKKYERIVLNIPHASIEGIAESGWQQGKSFFSKVREWTDWYTDYLFWSNQKQITPVRFNLSRFIVDVERIENDPLDAIGQGILYKKFVDCERTSDSSEQRRLLSAYYQHIDKLRNNLTSQSILIDCHSFPSVLSDIDICIGFNKDWSQPTNDVIDLFIEPFDKIGYKVGLNDTYSNAISPNCPFKYHSIMIEINKRIYMNELSLELSANAENVKSIISRIYNKLLMYGN